MPEKPLLHWQTAEYWSDPPSHFDLIPRWALHNSGTYHGAALWLAPRPQPQKFGPVIRRVTRAPERNADDGCISMGLGPVMFASWQVYIISQENCWTRCHLNVSVFVAETVWKRPPGSSLKRKRRSEMWRAINLCRLGTAHSASIYVWWAVQQKLSLPTIPRTLSLEDAWWLYLRQTVNACSLRIILQQRANLIWIAWFNSREVIFLVIGIDTSIFACRNCLHCPCICLKLGWPVSTLHSNWYDNVHRNSIRVMTHGGSKEH